MHDKQIVYLDNGATTQKPEKVIQAMCSYYGGCNANPHRGAYELSVQATDIYENARAKVQKFINAQHSHEIIFTKNATESLNLIAYSYGMSHIQAGDEVVIAISEHHSNLVPWQQICQLKGAVLWMAPSQCHIWQWMYRSWMQTSLFSPATRCFHLWALAFSTARKDC